VVGSHMVEYKEARRPAHVRNPNSAGIVVWHGGEVVAVVGGAQVGCSNAGRGVRW